MRYQRRDVSEFGYIHLELSREIWAGDTYLVVINLKMGIKPSMGVDGTA